MRKLAFIIINYNDYPKTKRLLDNIKDYKVIDHIYIIDNHSTDNSYDKLNKIKLDKLTVIRTEENKGFAYALNMGAKEVIKNFEKADIIFSNSDIIINSNENLEVLKKTLDKKDVGLVGPVVYENGHLNRGWIIPTPKIEILNNLPLLGRKFAKKNKYLEEFYKGDTSEVEVLSFCFFLIKSEVIEEMDFFDENTFLYYEENITASKLKNTKYKTLINNNITIIHDHSASIDKSINYINKFKILKKSQMYFEEHYNNASKLELFLLRLTIRLTLITLYVRIFIRGGLKNERNNTSRR